MGNSNRNIDYSCQQCSANVGRENLRAKRVQFALIGVNAKLLQTRTIAWLCGACMEADPDYQRPALAASPGMADTRLAERLESADVARTA